MQTTRVHIWLAGLLTIAGCLSLSFSTQIATPTSALPCMSSRTRSGPTTHCVDNRNNTKNHAKSQDAFKQFNWRP
ncbi:hypothetical protein ElyMa_004860000 [Elysia marginata]|uniref:Secreted protein n=1 Tax=Elysia marginata TaxID=1093978 RepID=A0AAV4IRT8_9GAST|nr:hypothetical protein ElyMa_004860000 [Elysia marginata]